MISETEGVIFDVMRYAIHDGPGIRTTVFFKGCPLRCIWCANPESQNTAFEIYDAAGDCLLCGRCARACPNNAVAIADGLRRLDRKACRACGQCVESCPTGALRVMGRKVTARGLFEEIATDWIFWERSGGGVTLSGGEPLMQPDFCKDLLKTCQEHHISTVVESCLHVPWESLEAVLPYVSHFICDIKVMDDAKHRRLTGVSNALIRKNVSFLLRSGKDVLIRVPLIPGINDTPADLHGLRSFLRSMPGRPRLEILPYHRLGEPKYERLGRTYPLRGLQPFSDEEVAAVRNLFGDLDSVTREPRISIRPA